MEGRYPDSIMLTLASCSDTERLTEWLDWYSRIHTPDITEGGIFNNMIRFLNTETNHEGRQVANLSECGFKDPYAALKELREIRAPYRDDNRQSPYTKIYGQEGPMVKISGEFQYVKNAPVRGIYIENISLTDPDQLRAFNYWYNDTHIPALLKTGLFQSAYRYRGLHPDGPLDTFVCIYETDREDPDEAITEAKELASYKLTGFEALKLNWNMTAKRIWPLEGR